MLWVFRTQADDAFGWRRERSPTPVSGTRPPSKRPLAIEHLPVTQSPQRRRRTEPPVPAGTDAITESPTTTYHLPAGVSTATVSTVSTVSTIHRPRSPSSVMKGLYPPLGTYRSQAQKEMIEVICQNKNPGAVFVLPTAADKSLAYIFPSLCDPAPFMTVAIVPFIAIKEETSVKALTLGLHAVYYQPGYEGAVPLLCVFWLIG